MAKNVEEWVASESKEDCDKIRMSLKPEKYALPMIRLTFGDQVLALPQNRITEFLAGCDSLKKSIVEANSKELKEKGIDIRLVNMDEKESYEKVCNAMGEILKEKGPYEVCGNAFAKNWDWESELYYIVDKEMPLDIEFGETQEWKVESKEPNEDTDEKS